MISRLTYDLGPSHRLNAILNERNDLNRKEAFGLVTVLSVDVILDLYGLWVCRSHWSRPALAARLVVGGGYITMFAVYYALGGRVFPSQFTFFGMKRSFAAPFLYLFMWTLGTWNVLWVVMYRHWLLGKGRRGDDEGGTGLGGSSRGGGEFRSQDDAVAQHQHQQHARKDSSASSASSAWRRPIWPFLRKGSLDDDDDATTIRVNEEQQQEVRPGLQALPPGYLDSIRLSQWRKGRNTWGNGVGDGIDARHESVDLQSGPRSQQPWRGG